MRVKTNPLKERIERAKKGLPKASPLSKLSMNDFRFVKAVNGLFLISPESLLVIDVTLHHVEVREIRKHDGVVMAIKYFKPPSDINASAEALRHKGYEVEVC